VTRHSDPHPFISLLTPVKGHRLFARLMRHLSPSQSLTVVILLLACFPQLDVVKNAPSPASLFSGLALDVVATRDKQARLRATESFLAGVVPVLVGVIGRLDLKLVAGLINMCGDRWDAATVMSTRVRLWPRLSSGGDP
jgi:DNA topoisomerase 2-associated protein PAT1